MKLYHKIFKSHADMSVYLENMDSLISYDEELLNRLTNARKVYKLFVRKGVLKDSPDNEIILTGSSRKKRRTLGGLISSQYAKEEILSDYYKLLKDIFIRLNIRNCIMHGLGESFDYLDRGIAAIMFQLLWDIRGGEVFRC